MVARDVFAEIHREGDAVPADWYSATEAVSIAFGRSCASFLGGDGYRWILGPRGPFIMFENGGGCVTFNPPIFVKVTS